ncbi:hypothetical protein D3C75_1066890 [compost metagenome]
MDLEIIELNNPIYVYSMIDITNVKSELRWNNNQFTRRQYTGIEQMNRKPMV